MFDAHFATKKKNNIAKKKYTDRYAVLTLVPSLSYTQYSIFIRISANRNSNL